jgi:RNA polymerase sigma factor (sigma-70 family)
MLTGLVSIVVKLPVTKAPLLRSKGQVMSPADIEELYVGHARRIAGYLMRATNDAEVAADLTAETFAAALLARDRYRADMGSPTTWLYAIAANKLKDWRRRGYAEDRARRRLRIERPPLREADLAEFGRLADEVTADALLEALPADQGTALRAHVLDERPYGEIAVAEGVSEAAIRQRVSRGLAALRQRIGGDR